MREFNYYRVNSYADIGTKEFDNFIMKMFPHKMPEEPTQTPVSTPIALYFGVQPVLFSPQVDESEEKK